MKAVEQERDAYGNNYITFEVRNVRLALFSQQRTRFFKPFRNGNPEAAGFSAGAAFVAVIEVVPFQAEDRPRRGGITIHECIVINFKDARHIDVLPAGHTAAAGGAGDGLKSAVGIPDPVDNQLL